MEAKVNFTLVGLFVLVLAIGLIGGVLWLGSDKQFGKHYDTYLVYIAESVSGLNLNAPVKYRGVDVGSVGKIELDMNDSERVRLSLNIEHGSPIKEDTVAVLRTQGLTGIAYVDLMGGSKDSPLLKAKGTEKYPVIQSGPSLMARLDVALTGVLANLNRVSENINAALDEENRRALKQSLADVAAVARTLANRTDSIDAGIRDASRTMENTARASRELTQLVARMERSADAVEKMAGSSGVQQFTGETLPELHGLVGELRETAGSLRRASQQIEQNPAVLLYGKATAKPGPGE